MSFRLPARLLFIVVVPSRPQRASLALPGGGGVVALAGGAGQVLVLDPWLAGGAAGDPGAGRHPVPVLVVVSRLARGTQQQVDPSSTLEMFAVSSSLIVGKGDYSDQLSIPVPYLMLVLWLNF